MPNRRLPVSKIKEILRLRFAAGLSERKIARSCNTARKTVSEYLSRASEAGLSWPDVADLAEEELHARLFPPAAPTGSSRPLPDWAYVRKEAARPGVTLLLLWEEYRTEHPDGYGRTQFYTKYRAWCETLEPVMRVVHKAGDKVFVDYSGQKVPIANPKTGEVREAELFVGTLGASSYTYAEATWTQTLPDWIGSHVRMFAFFGGVPRLIVPDNLKSGVTKACFYEPGINDTYAKMAEHYGVAVLPARVREPTDKAKVESAVGVAQRRILARLRNRTFFSLGELNEAIAELLVEMNDRPFQKLDGSRRSLFEDLERDALSPLPRTAYVYREWKKARAGIDYHVAVEKHYYSVPFTYIKRKLDVCLTSETVEVFASGERIASHRRSFRQGGYTTVLAHMPKSHQQYAEWSPQRIIRWASKTGPSAGELVERLIDTYQHPEHGYRAALGIMRLAKTYSDERLEAACHRALAIGTCRYQSVKSILAKGLDQVPLPETDRERAPINHTNIRGADYYR